MIESRRVRATRAGASAYVLSSRRISTAPEYSLGTQPLWGG